MDNLSGELELRFAGLDQRRRIEVLPARSVRIHPALDRTLVPMATLLMGVVGVVLALVCANLAVMLLLRGANRLREVSIRLAMGAARMRIVRQFLTESLVLSMAGGVVGCLAAVWLLDVISATDLPVAMGVLANGQVNFSVDLRVLAFATALSILTGIAFGVLPAVRAIKTEAVAVMGSTTVSRRHVATRYAMVSFRSPSRSCSSPPPSPHWDSTRWWRSPWVNGRKRSGFESRLAQAALASFGSSYGR
jgi:hypothetical protein